MGKYQNTKNFTGLNVDNYLERASKAVVFQEGSNLVNGAIAFGKTVGSENNNISSDSGLSNVGYVQLYTESGGIVKPVSQIYDATSEVVVIVGDVGVINTMPASYSAWFDAHHNLMIGSVIKFGCQHPTTEESVHECYGVVIGQKDETLQIYFSLFNQYYVLLLNSSSGSFIQWSAKELASSENFLSRQAGSGQMLYGDLYLNGTDLYLNNSSNAGHLGDQENIGTVLYGEVGNPLYLHSYNQYFRIPTIAEETSSEVSSGAHILATREWSNDNNKYHASGSWNNFTYTAVSVNNAEELSFTIPVGTTGSTVAVGNHTHNYLPLTGGNMSGDVSFGESVVSGYDISGVKNLTAGMIYANHVKSLTSGAILKLQSGTHGSYIVLNTENAINYGISFCSVINNNNVVYKFSEDDYDLTDQHQIATRQWANNTFAPEIHTHEYLPLTGGTLSGNLSLGDSVGNGNNISNVHEITVGTVKTGAIQATSTLGISGSGFYLSGDAGWTHNVVYYYGNIKFTTGIVGGTHSYSVLPLHDGSTDENPYTLATQEWTEEVVNENYISLEDMQSVLNSVGHILGFSCTNITKDSEHGCVVTLADNGDTIIRVLPDPNPEQ